MPVPHPTAVIGQQLAIGRPSSPPWQDRPRRPRHPRHRTSPAVAALRALPRLAHVVRRPLRPRVWPL